MVYGLGSENQNLPAYVVLDDPRGLPVNGIENWQAGFLPPIFQGTRFRSTGSPVLNLRPDVDRPADVVQRGTRPAGAARPDPPASSVPASPTSTPASPATSWPRACSWRPPTPWTSRRRAAATQEMYGLGRAADRLLRPPLPDRPPAGGARRALRAALHQRPDLGQPHRAGDRPEAACDRTDQPIAALLRDLKQRGLLDSTLVVWGGEFGRLPIAQLPPDKDERKAGRDHNKNGFCIWLAGGGIKGGTTYGATDELGLAAVENRVSVPDWHATILHLLGLHHECPEPEVRSQTFLIRSRIESASATQVNGFGSTLCASMYSLMASTRAGTLRKAPRRMRFSVISAKNRSI